MAFKNVYQKEFKDEVLAKVRAGETAVSVAQAYGIRPALIYKWASVSAQSSSSIVEISRLKRENLALKQLIGELTLSISNLKKR
jgi:transposase-like protein